MIRRDRILGARVDAGTREEFLGRILSSCDGARTARVLFANVHMVVESGRNPALREAMAAADLVCPDGMPIVRLLSLGGTSQRMEGMSAFPELLDRAESSDLPVALFGSTQAVLDLVSDKIRRERPALRLVFALAPPCGQALDERASEHLARLRESGAKLVFVALGCPRQELWISKVEDVPACFLGVGNALEVYAGVRRRAPRWARPLCLEWMFRLAREPRRLGWRYLSTNSRFLLALPREIVRRTLR